LCFYIRERLKACELTTLHYRQIRGDMIETYKIISESYDNNTTTIPMSDICVTKGNDLRLQKSRSKYDTRKFFLQTGLRTIGTVCLTGLLQPIILNYF